MLFVVSFHIPGATTHPILITNTHSIQQYLGNTEGSMQYYITLRNVKTVSELEEGINLIRRRRTRLCKRTRRLDKEFTLSLGYRPVNVILQRSNTVQAIILVRSN